MYISKIIIKNYRGIKNESLDFDKFNTLIGKNDCGKSTIINAIKMFFNDEKASPKDFNYYETENRDIEIEVFLSDYTAEDIKPYLINGEKDDGFENVSSDYILDGQLNLKKIWTHKDSGEVGASMFLLVNEFTENPIYSLTTAKLKALSKSKEAEPPTDGTGNNSDTERRAFIRSKLIEEGESQAFVLFPVKHKDLESCLPMIELLKADQSIETTTTEFKGTFTTEVKTIIKNEKENGDDSTLKEIEDKIKNKIKEEGEAIKNCMAEHISDLEQLFINPNFSWEKGVEITEVLIQLTGDQKPIPLENKGSGYRRLFMVGRLRYLAEKKQSENVIYLVEEPETFLHPSAQDEMLHSLITLSDSNQVFVTTHSPIFTGATQQNAITLCKKENTELVYQQHNSDENLLDIAKQLGVKPSHNILDSYETIVFVEGSNDRSFLEISSNKLGKDLHTKCQDGIVAIIDGGGGSLSNFIDIKYFEKQQKKMFLVIDSDEYDETQITCPNKRKSLDDQIERNKALKEKFEQKDNATAFILNKKNIDTYYHPGAIKRINPNFPELAVFDNKFCFSTYVKEHEDNIDGNLTKKNWIEVFEEMTTEEWQTVSNNELEGIIDSITA
jgi:predicted ATP-dependent endonuclease of OLD family